MVNKNINLPAFFITCVILVAQNTLLAHAQSSIIQTRKEIFDDQIRKITDLSDPGFKNKDVYINGSLASHASNKFIHPFFIDNSWRSGVIFYRGREFRVNMLKYNTNTDCLEHLMMLDQVSYPICLNKDFIDEFRIDQHHFRYLGDFGISNDEKLKPGYYELVYDGKVKCYIKREKQENLHNNISDLVYTEWIYMFLSKNDIYYRINNNASLIKALNDHRDEIRLFIRTNHLRIEKGHAESMKQILRYYDNL